MNIILAFALLVLSACSDPNNSEQQKVEPLLPPAIGERYIAPGDAIGISFSANVDWTVSIPSSSSDFFYISDNGFKDYRISGKAGNVSLDIVSLDVQGNYDEKVCPVLLTMGDKSMELVKVHLIAKERNVRIYSASYDENGTFHNIGSGEYAYEENTSDVLEMSWPKGLSSFMLPVKISANFPWSIKEDYPEWMDVSNTSSQTGEATIMIKGNAAKYPLEKAEGMITFLDLNSGEPMFNIPVSIPGCKDIAYVDTDVKSVELNILGEYKQNGNWTSEGYPFYLTSTLDADIIAVDYVGGKYSYNVEDSWVKLASSFPSGVPTQDVVQDRVFRVSADKNPGVEREAVLLAVPGYILSTSDLASELVTSDGKNISEKFEKYRCLTVKQLGSDPSEGWGTITPVNSALLMAVRGAGIHRTSESEPYYSALSSKFSTDEIYTLEYNNWYSYEGADLAVGFDIENVAYYNEDGSVEDTDGYLSVVNPDANNANLIEVVVEYFEEGKQETVVLSDNSGNIAVILVRMTETFWPDVKFDDIRFVAYDMVNDGDEPDESIIPQNVILEKVESGDIFDQYSSYGIPIWRLVYQTPSSDRNAMLYVPPFPLGEMSAIDITPASSWIKVESAMTEGNMPYIHVTMSDKNPEQGNIGHVVLKGAGRPLFVLVCERAFMNNK
ncbi:MAG: hypothetical protein MJZ16_04420 [Bacteroidales bacterium]|nr:hypothetical protein [Bacteroidales bacterium]